MKMLIVVYSDAVDDVLVETFKKTGLQGYTKWKQTVGEGSESEPKLGTHYWPGTNNVLAAVCNDDEALQFKKAILRLKTEHPKGGIRTFILEVAEMI